MKQYLLMVAIAVGVYGTVALAGGITGEVKDLTPKTVLVDE